MTNRPKPSNQVSSASGARLQISPKDDSMRYQLLSLMAMSTRAFIMLPTRVVVIIIIVGIISGSMDMSVLP